MAYKGVIWLVGWLGIGWLVGQAFVCPHIMEPNYFYISMWSTETVDVKDIIFVPINSCFTELCALELYVKVMAAE